jgi:hypothetical protein
VVANTPQRWRVAGNSEVTKVTPEHLHQLLVLVPNWGMALLFAVLIDPFHEPTNPLLGGFMFDYPVATLRLAPVVGKPEKVKRILVAFVSAWLAKVDESRLFWVDCKSVFRQSLWQYCHQACKRR